MKKILLASIIFLVSINTFAQKRKKKNNSKSAPSIVLEIGDKKIPKEDFLYVYKKNRKVEDTNFTYEDLNEYMELYIKFQLKVVEAEAQGLDTLPSFLKEFEGYRKKLAKPYLSDDEFTKKWARIEYDRQKEEVNASHILIKISGEQVPEDTLKAYNKILAIKKEVESGLNFGEAAIKYSEDPSSKMKEYPIGYKGNLGYFSAFDMVFEFENAAFQNPVGSLVGPVKTQFGYHLLKVKDRRPAKAKRNVSHIMILAANGIARKDSLIAVEKIFAIKSELNLENWNEMCLKYSEHAKSKDKGGELGAIKIGGKLGSPEFEKVAFALKEPGDISAPIKTAYGWHIVKFNSEEKIPSFEEQQKELINKVSKNGAIVEMGKVQFAERIKKENKFKEFNSPFEKCKVIIDSTYLTRGWKYDENKPEMGLTLFKIRDKEYRVGMFFEYLNDSRSWYVKGNQDALFIRDYENYKLKMLFDYEEGNLSKKYPSYRHLVQEYRDGILLFDLMNKTIWKKSTSDSVALKNFYNEHIEDYQWSTRANSTVYYLYDTTKTVQLRKLLQVGDAPNDSLMNSSSSLSMKTKVVTIEKGKTDDEFNELKWEKRVQEFVKNDYRIFVVIDEVLPPVNKELNECKGQVISDYQIKLESDWIDELKEKHKFILHENVLKSLSVN